jgi:hypothetical protein
MQLFVQLRKNVILHHEGDCRGFSKDVTQRGMEDVRSENESTINPHKDCAKDKLLGKSFVQKTFLSTKQQVTKSVAEYSSSLNKAAGWLHSYYAYLNDFILCGYCNCLSNQDVATSTSFPTR